MEIAETIDKSLITLTKVSNRMFEFQYCEMYENLTEEVQKGY